MRLNPQNPKVKGVEVYDPKREHLRAQQQGIYESQVTKYTGGIFRDRKGLRVDARALNLSDDPQKTLELIRETLKIENPFRIGTGVQQRLGLLEPDSKKVTQKGAAESKRRYADYDKLIRNRQDYEETLSLGRLGDFYRVTQERTTDGKKYFVWPMPPGETWPVRLESRRAAKILAKKLSQTAVPIYDGIWWTPPKKKYHWEDLDHWLPPAAFWRE